MKNPKRIDITPEMTRAVSDTCSIDCPHCQEPMDIGVKAMMAKKDGEIAETRDALTKKNDEHTKLVADLGKRDGELTEARAILKASEERASSLAATNADLGKQLMDMRVAGAKRDLEGLVATKLYPNELDAELELARLYFANQERVVDGTDAGKLVGEVKWNERLALIKARADHHMTSDRIVKQSAANGDALPIVANGAARSTTGGDGFGSLLDKELSKASA